MRKCRTEVTIIGELCEAWLLADCEKVRSQRPAPSHRASHPSGAQVLSVGWDESTKFQTGIASTNFQVVAGPNSWVEPGTVVDVVGRGCFVIPGGTAEQAAIV